MVWRDNKKRSIIEIILISFIFSFNFIFINISVVSANNPSSSTTMYCKNEEDNAVACSSNNTPTTTTGDSNNFRVSNDCGLVMAPSTIADGGWGVYTLESKSKDTLVADNGGEIVIQIVDLNAHSARGLRRLIWEYMWDAQETGGQYEGRMVRSMSPGFGALANGDNQGDNIVWNSPSLQLERKNHAGAGAYTYYHNLTWSYTRDMQAGDELFVNYGKEWFKERGFRTTKSNPSQKSVSWLREFGYCIDNIYAKTSEISLAGRGAFAKRKLPKDSIVAPVPVIPLTRDSMELIKERHEGDVVRTKQLLLNYCFGHVKSDILLYPYSPMINLINHHSKRPNVSLRWSTSSNNRSMLMELVALRDIHSEEELYLDYGKEWEDAWKKHVETYRRKELNTELMSSWDLDQALQILPTEAEQKHEANKKLPEHIFISVYYQYDTTTRLWKDMDLKPRFLRPCRILGRNGEEYTIQVLNRPGLSKGEHIPQTQFPWIVQGVPRKALKLSDIIYTTDQHSTQAFRQEIGLDIFPKAWMNL